MQLIEITKNEKGEQLVSARELHSFLESKQDFTTWIKNRIEKYDFVENEDFTLHKFMEGKNWKHDYILKTDIAKEISMVEGNEKGKVARKYFISCEKQLKELSIPSYQVTDPIARAKAWIQEQKEKQELEYKIKENIPKIEFYEVVTGSDDTFDLGTVAKVINKKGYGRNKLFEFLRENKILMQNNQPYQKYIDIGYFRMIESKITKPAGDTCTNIKTVVFQKGVDYITKLLNKNV